MGLLRKAQIRNDPFMTLGGYKPEVYQRLRKISLELELERIKNSKKNKPTHFDGLYTWAEDRYIDHMYSMLHSS